MIVFDLNHKRDRHERQSQSVVTIKFENPSTLLVLYSMYLNYHIVCHPCLYLHELLLIRLLATKSATHLFVMELKDNCFIDSRKKASISRFINHSCEPNCTIEIWTVKHRLKAAIFALKDIPHGTELTFDYQWAPSEGRPPTRLEDISLAVRYTYTYTHSQIHTYAHIHICMHTYTHKHSF